MNLFKHVTGHVPCEGFDLRMFHARLAPTVESSVSNTVAHAFERGEELKAVLSKRLIRQMKQIWIAELEELI